jgi:hypothetical protein
MGRLWAVVALVAGVSAGFALNACGGDDSPEVPISTPTEATTAGEALSKSEYIDEADQRCQETNDSIGRFVEQGEGYTGAGEIADLRQDLLDQLRELGPPEESRTTLNEFLTALENQVTAGQKIALGIERNEDTSQFETELTEAQADAQSAAEQYGFKECGSPITATDTSGSAGTGTDTGAASGGTAAPAPAAPAPAPASPAPAPPSDSGGTGTGGGDSGGDDSGGGSGGLGVP